MIKTTNLLLGNAKYLLITSKPNYKPMKPIFIFLFFICIFYKAQSQGCSDAGFCTAGGIKPLSNIDSIRNSLGFTFGFGIGEQGTLILTPQFEPQIKVRDKGMIQIKIPYVLIMGDYANNKGLGDVVLTYNYLFDSVAKNPITCTFGTRIAMGTASLKNNNIPMPMPYQVSLGTTDIILGAKLQFKKGFSISIGFQQPLFNRNQNGFDSAAYLKLKTQEQLKPEDNFFISSYLKRKGDIMMRIDKSFQFTKTSISIGLLPIYHLGKDKVETTKGHEIEIEGSQGLTLNVNASLNYKLTSKFEISAVAAMPLIVRKSRPDGLTRSFVFIPGIKYYL